MREANINHVEHLLTVLAEEAVEVAQRATKAMRFGLEEVQHGRICDNRERLMIELNELWAICEMLDLAHVDREVIEDKKRRVLKYMEYAEQECKTLSEHRTVDMDAYAALRAKWTNTP